VIEVNKLLTELSFDMAVVLIDCFIFVINLGSEPVLLIICYNLGSVHEYSLV
jgi:hypothetical protein